MKLWTISWRMLIVTMAFGALTVGMAACGDSGNSFPGGVDGTDPSGGDGDSDGDADGDTDPKSLDSDADTGYNGTVDPDAEVEEQQQEQNEGCVTIGGVTVCPEAGSAPTVIGTTDWKYGARAGYSMVHDDICDYQMVGTEEGWKIAGDRGLPVGWGIITSRCSRMGYGDPEGTFTTPYWNLVTEMDQGGQEIINHSITHPNLKGLSQCSKCTDVTNCTDVCPSEMKDMDGKLISDDVSVINTASTAALDFELIQSGVDINAAVSFKPEFYVYPLDVADDNMFTILKGDGYLGSRGGDREADGTLNDPDVDTSDPLADFRILFDAYNESAAWASHHTQDGLDHMLDAYLNEAVKQGKWGLRELHSIRPTCTAQGHGWGPVTESLYSEHLDNVKCRIEARQVWMAKNVDIVKYRRTRAHCGTPTLSGSTLSFSDAANAECVKYATDVTVAIQGAADTIADAVSAGGDDAIINLPNGMVLITMNPTASVDVTFGTGTIAAATDTCATHTSGLDATQCVENTECQPLGGCMCEEPLATLGAYDASATISPDGGGACEAYTAAAGSFPGCGASSASDGWKTITPDGSGYCTVADGVYGEADGSQYGLQLSFFDDAGFMATPKSCTDGSASQGVRVCVQGEVKNGFPKTRYVAQGVFDILDSTRKPTETQNMVWVYLVTDYTAKVSDWNAGHCDNENCAHPFFAMNINADSENCQDIAWSDFEFPYWWGDANVGFVMPEVCSAGGAVPSAESCTVGEDYDPSTEEPLARWHACSGMSDKIIQVIVAAVDDIGSAPVETVGMKAKVTFF